MKEQFRQRRMYLFLLILTIGSTVAFQGWRTLLNNYAVEWAGFDGAQIGLVQSMREVPGFLALLALYVLYVMREHTLAAVSVFTLGAGVLLTGFFPDFWGILLTTMLMSFGFHYYETMNQSLTLQGFSHVEAPLVMGRLRSYMALTNIATGLVIWALASTLSYPWLFGLAGAVAIGAGLWAFGKNPVDCELHPQAKKLVFKRKYWLYYALSFLSGARRQVFVAFAVFLLVQRFGYSVQHVTILFVLNNVVNYFANPILGRAVNRLGERTVLTMEYASLLAVFTAYAFTDSALVAGALYVVDNLFFNFSMAIKTFYQKIADREDIASGMAVGFTINHIAAVVIPALGGLAWLTDYRIVFLGAAGLSLASLIMTQFIDAQLARKRQR